MSESRRDGAEVRIESESKLELDQAGFERLMRAGKILGVDDQLNIYYDCAQKLAKSASTFRVRFIRERSPVVTLKIPREQHDEWRQATEVESTIAPWLARRRCFEVQEGLPEPFVRVLVRMGVHKLHRLGWMRTRRWTVQLPNGTAVELDKVTLPNGSLFFEVEIESSDRELQLKAVGVIQSLTMASAKPSSISKYERFVRALEDSGRALR